MLSTAFAAQFVMYTPGGDDTAVERADPILFPDTISAHVHQIFGASAFTSELSYDALQASECTTVGDASGDGNGADKSSYWHPALYMESANGTGYVRVPTSGHKLYYRDVGNDADKKADPFEFPKGYRMVAGNPFQRAAGSDAGSQGITQWMCHSSSGSSEGDKGGFPTDVSDCDAYPGFNGAIHYPHCWNGEDFDQSNPSAHYSYPEGDVQSGPCPSSHPIRLPHIFIENQFDLHSVVDQVKPNTFVLAQGDSTGFGWHMDFFNGWDEGAIPELMKSCPAPYYGNADIGTCPTFKKFDTKAADCKLKVTFDENVDTPGNDLPGCNPVQTTNPAVKMAVAALGEATDKCSASSGGSGSSGSSAPAYSASSAPASSASSAPESSAGSAPAYEAPSSSASPTTLATSPVAITATAYGDKNANNNVVYETQYVTVTARDLPTPAARAAALEARHGHALKHLKGRGHRL
ncbi:hypothetical protein M409DRAFT_63346 [Zasmidium cellare ATCC 36951]|uniref:DUF1996 domain-containing protein n=1 Tax=Zasmidium cellare ATCC 36951 TaxID=1080233 RepID=A0A6A6CX66_ZASCE|nr:uncharacterized protein M409DRAFT_63346 [Zasmidium cellare ATCC 36951]KAF2171744.1 hypothetical protein M409DRAFT_63346 [Zasmidium cellare ATCC 36951]